MDEQVRSQSDDFVSELTTTEGSSSAAPASVPVPTDGVKEEKDKAGGWAKRAVKSPYSAIGVTAIATMIALWQGWAAQRGLAQARVEFQRAELRERYQAIDAAIITVGRFQRSLRDCLIEKRTAEECGGVLYDLHGEAKAAALDANLAMHYPDIHEWMSELYLVAEARQASEAARTLSLLRELIDAAEDRLRGPDTYEGLRGPPRMRRLRDVLGANELEAEMALHRRFDNEADGPVSATGVVTPGAASQDAP
jgi:hypothetical protein